MFGTKYFCLCLRSGTARLQEPVLFQKKIVRGIRSKTVRLCDPGFCLKPSISVYGPGPFGSGGLFFVWDEFSLVRL